MVEIWSVIFDSERVKIDFSIYSFRPLKLNIERRTKKIS